jgi:hypothetical protein
MLGATLVTIASFLYLPSKLSFRSKIESFKSLIIGVKNHGIQTQIREGKM